MLAAGRSLPAQPPPLSADSPAPQPVRSGAPISLVWPLHSQSTSLLEGRLELTVHDGPDVLARVVTDERVLSTGDQLVRTVLPPMDTHDTYNSVEIHLKFVGPQQTIDLKDHPLRLPNAWQRFFVVGVCDPWQSNLSQSKQNFLKRFRFESYHADAGDRTITTSLSHVRPTEMPGDPLGYCGYDLVVLIDEGFLELKEAQLQALLAWVDAGGSLCLVPGRRGLDRLQLQFLNRLIDGTDSPEFTANIEDLPRQPPPIEAGVPTEAPEPEPQPAPDGASNEISTANPAGEVDTNRASGEKLLLRPWGLGRIAVLRDGLSLLDDPKETDLRRLLAFLWRLRVDQSGSFLSGGQWKVQPPSGIQPGMMQPLPGQPMPAQQVNVQQASGIYDEIRRPDAKLAPIALQTGDQLLGRLMPRDLRVVPLWIVGLVLFLYVLVIGPADYLLLGAIRRRKLTWIVFPAVTIAFAVATVLFSNWYMSTSDNRRSVTILDIGQKGNVARRNQFQVLFRGTPGQSVTEVSKGFLSAMNHQQFSRGTWYTYQMAVNRGTEGGLELVRPPVYRGRVPAQYTLEQQLPQWTPQLNRLMQIPPADNPPAFDWGALVALDASQLALGGPESNRIAQAVRDAFGSAAISCIAHGTQILRLSGQALPLQQDDQGFYTADPYANVYYPGMNQQIGTTFLQDVCSPWTAGGLFSVVSQISPTGGRNFEDLALLDPSNPRQWLLVIFVEQGDDLLVYRKLYTGEP